MVFTGFVVFLDGMGQIRVFLAFQGWTGQVAAGTQSAAHNSSIFPSNFWLEDPRRYLRILPVLQTARPLYLAYWPTILFWRVAHSSSQVKFLLSTQIQNSPPLVPGAGSLRRRQNLNHPGAR